MSDQNPQANADAAAPGAGNKAAREDHVHPRPKRHIAAAAPTVNNDAAEGYSAWSLWADTSGAEAEVYRCVDASAGAAVWVKTSLTIDELGTLAAEDDAPADGKQYTRKDGAWAESPAAVLAPQIATGAAHTITGTGFAVPITISAFGATDKDALRLAVDHRTTAGPGEWTRTSTISVTTLGAHDVQVSGLAITTGYDYRAVALDALNPAVEVLGEISATETANVYVEQPSITAPADLATAQALGPDITTSAFAVANGEDTHASTDWQIATDTLFASVVWQSLADASNKVSVTVPGGNLASGTIYYLRARHHGSVLDPSAWSATIQITTDEVAQPSITSPTEAEADISPTATITSSAFSVGSSDTHAKSDWQVATDTLFASVVFASLDDATNKTSIQLSGLDPSTTYYARVRHHGTAFGASAWSATRSFATAAITIDTPALTITGEPASVPETPILAGGDFGVTGGSDTHLNTDWQILGGAMEVVWESLADAANKTSIVVPAGELAVSTEYTFRVRYRGTTYGASAWASTAATTLDQFYTGIGTQGAQGFGLNAYPGPTADLTALGLTAMTGATDPAHANYGNYQHTNGSIFVFIPKFYYRIGSASSPRYATYGLNAHDVASDFPDTATANAAGYALHRAFINGGVEQPGVFRAKYFASKDGENSIKCVANGVPISLATTATYTRSQGMLTGACTGILADALPLSKTLGAAYHPNLFVRDALRMISIAHGQAATATTYCAWYDAGLTTNFPKGCNNNALGDTNDGTISYTTAGDSGSANKPLTGSGAPFAKTTHNGQACGVADINGCMWEVGLGVTSPGSSATSTTAIASGDVYVLKESTDIATLTGGWNTGTDAWGDATHLATLYDSQVGLLPWGATTGWIYFGNGANQVFDPALSGAGWLRTACGIQASNDAMSAGGTNLFGADGCYRYNVHNLFLLSGGNWSYAATAGPSARHWSSSRSGADAYASFAPSAYVQ